MPSVTETATGGTPLSAALSAGLGNISYQQAITFIRYLRLVLPIDGFIFWCRASIVIPGSAAYNQAMFNEAEFNGDGDAPPIENEIDVKGSWHQSTTQNQNEADSGSINQIVFTTEEQIEHFNAIGQNEMWVAQFGNESFAFRESFKRYPQAGLWHYRGQSLLVPMATQLIDSADQLDAAQAVVSNSLPIWLSLNAKAPVYPSFAIPLNLRPPYIAAHIEPSSTKALQAAPLIDMNGSHWQLATERVKFTLYGLRSDEALDYQDYLFNVAYDDSSPFGVMNIPIMQDEKMTQVEFQTIAQKKTFTMEISYYQARVQQIARQLILSATIAVTTS